MFKIKKLGILSVAKTLGLIYAVIGLLIGVTVTLMYVFILVKFGNSFADLGMWGTARVIAILFLPPVAYTVMGLIMGFVGGALCAFLYNHATRFIGGIEVEITEVTKVHHHKTHTEEKKAE